MFKQNGMLPWKSITVWPMKHARKLKLACLLLGMGVLLSACQTTSGTATTGNKAMKNAFRAITYSSSKDTAPTVRQIRVHNETGRKLKLWR